MQSKKQQTVNLFEQFCDTDFLINMIYDVATQDEACGVIECKLQFLSCLTQATKSEKQKALKKHKTTTQKKVHCNKIKENYLNMEPAKKKTVVGN